MTPVFSPKLLGALRHGAREEDVGASLAVGQLLNTEGLRDQLRYRFGFPLLLSQCLNPRTFLMCSRYSPARRFFVIRWISTVTSGTGGFIPFRSRNSNGSETSAKRFVQ